MYRDDLAWIHHHGFGDSSAAIGPEILDLMARAGIRTGRVLDLGCGGGTWLATAAAAGYETHGIDISGSLLRIAARSAPRASLQRASLWEAQLPRADVITALGEVLCYVEESSAQPSLAPLMHRMYEALPAGGMALFDLLTAAPAAEPMRYHDWKAGEDWAVLVDVEEQRGEALVRRRITSFRRHGETFRRDHEEHLVRVFEEAEVIETLAAAGFDAQVASGYGEVMLPPRRRAFIAYR